MNVKNLHLEVSNQALTLRFELGRGQYATSVLRELMDVIDGLTLGKILVFADSAADGYSCHAYPARAGWIHD